MAERGTETDTETETGVGTEDETEAGLWRRGRRRTEIMTENGPGPDRDTRRRTRRGHGDTRAVTQWARTRTPSAPMTPLSSSLSWSNDIIHYDNDENPFGDSSLTKTFRWDKKLEKEGLKNIKDDELDRMAQARIVEQKQELEKAAVMS